MSSTDKSVDEQLLEFLQADAKARAKGYTIGNLLAEMHSFRKELETIVADRKAKTKEFDEVKVLVAEHQERLNIHRHAILDDRRALKKMAKAEGEFFEEMNTGNFDVVAIQREVEEQKRKRLDSERIKAEQAIWYQRTFVKVLLATFGFIAVTATTTAITYMINGSHHETNTTQINTGK